MIVLVYTRVGGSRGLSAMCVAGTRIGGELGVRRASKSYFNAPELNSVLSKERNHVRLFFVITRQLKFLARTSGWALEVRALFGKAIEPHWF